MTEEKIRKWATDVWGVSNWTQIQIDRLRRFVEMARDDEREGFQDIIRARGQS